MQKLHSYYINKQFILLIFGLAFFLHMSLIPASKFLYIQNDEKIEPKIVLELINELNINDMKPDPINNPINFNKENIIIDKPQAIQKIEKINKEIPIIKNLVETDQKIKDIDLEINKVENELIKINKPQILNNIIMPKKNDIKIKPLVKLKNPLPITRLINVKINPNINVENIDNEIKIKPLEKLKEPLPITPLINVKINPNINIENIDNQINISNLPSKVRNSSKKIDKIIIKNNNKLSEKQLNALENYKNEIRSEIQLFAIENYPKKLIRRKIQGIVQLIFKLNTDGSIISITNGPNTKAPDELITAAINALRKSAPFNNNKLLKEKNEFSIDIVYKIQ